MRGSLLDENFRRALMDKINAKTVPACLDESLPDYDLELRIQGLHCGRMAYADICQNLIDKGVDLREREKMANSLN